MEERHPKVIDHQFVVEALLAEGSFAKVYRVKRGGETWALKLLKKPYQRAQGEAWVEAFRFEFSLLKDISHPAVVRIGDFGWDRDIEALYFTEELIDGMPLDEFLRRQGPSNNAWRAQRPPNGPDETPRSPPTSSQDLNVALAEALLIQCLEGLEAIHRAGAVHGDIKPSNIYVIDKAKATPRIKILDLGIAHPKFQLIAGTPSYFAPEKVLNEAVDERADLYSLGVTFFECLTGTNPFTRDKASETLKAQVAVAPPAPGALNRAIPPWLNRILVRLLEKNPSDRHRTAGEVLAEIDSEKGLPREAAPQAILISEKWVGRQKTLEAIRRWVEAKKGAGLLFLYGEPGIGKTRLIHEIRYELELKGVPVRTDCASTDARMPAETIFLIDLNRFDPAGLEALSGGGWRGIVALLPGEAEKAGQWAVEHSIPAESATLEAMTRDDVRELIVLSTRDENPPDIFVSALYAETKGHAGTTVSLLWALCRAGKLLGPHGEWNLAPFREGAALDYALLPMTPSEREQLASRLGDEKPLEKAELLIEICDEKLHLARSGQGPLDKGAWGTIPSLFREVENLIGRLPLGDDRLKLRIALLEKKGWKSIREEDFDGAKRELEVALGLLEELNPPPLVLSLRIRNYHAFVLMCEGQIDKAVEIFEKTEREWKKLLNGEEQRRVTNNDLPMALMQKGEYAKAAEFLKARLGFYEKLSDRSFKNRCRYNLGECLLKSGDPSQAIGHYEAAADGAREERQWDLLLRAYNGLGNACNILKKTDRSLSNYQRALDLSRYLKDWGAASAVAQNMGVIQQELGQSGAAEKNLNLSLQLLKQVEETSPHLRYLKARAILELGEIERQRKNFDKAREFFGQASQLVLHEKGLEGFVFWVLNSQASLLLDENRGEDFARLYPDLLYHAKTDEQKTRLEFLRKRSPVDPTLSRFEVAAPLASAAPPASAVPLAPAPAGPVPPEPKKEIQEIQPHPVGVRPLVDPLLAVLQINSLLGTERDLKTLLNLVLQYALSLSNAESGLVLLADERGELSVASARNIDVDDDLSQISRKTAQEVLKSGKPLRSDNASADPAFKNYRSVLLLGLKSVFCLPIGAGGKVIGVLYLTHRFQTALFDERIAGVMRVFADQAGLAINNARLNRKIEEQNRRLAGRLNTAEESIETYKTILREKSFETRYSYAGMVTQSPAMEKIFALLDRVTGTNLSVLIRGESGTGKELVARALHKNSPRAGRPFMAINCGALPVPLIESELFGYKAGAFTGAMRDKPGLFEMAGGGTLFLDEIGELDFSLQAKLLRALQEREILRLGDTKPIPIDVRIVSATHKNLRHEMAERRFRDDLYYRIAEVELALPPLRDRREDIPLLVSHFAREFAKEHGRKKAPSVSKEFLRLFVGHDWPGNVRELANRVRVACALSDGKVLDPGNLPEGDKQVLQGIGKKGKEGSPCPKDGMEEGGAETVQFIEKFLQEQKTWRDIENIIFAKSLLETGFDVSRAARSLGIGIATLYNRLRRERFRQRKGELDSIPFRYREGTLLDTLKHQVFHAAFTLSEEHPYLAARRLGVSPATFYQWLKSKRPKMEGLAKAR
ncbi:MAG: sigma 54-interacting transcriptional regulator [Deltaproteobacteria bacterium]|nr:sigma 54-interacting transcriptional regulator [Deltaproteobacteria bacterium]